MANYVASGYLNSGYVQTDIYIDWSTKIIHVPVTVLELIQETPTKVYQLDLNALRLRLKELEQSVLGMAFPITHNNNSELSVGGVTLARAIEILEPYTITFEDGQYAVNLIGANSNVGDRVNVNQVSVRSANSAGLVTSQAIEFGEYGGAVTIDVNKGEPGTLYPIGTVRRPSNNIDDAHLIAEIRGFGKFNFLSDFTFTSDIALYDAYEFHGQGSQSTTFTFEAGCILANSEVYDATVTGFETGLVGFNDCLVRDLGSVGLAPSSIGVVAKNCFFEGTLTLPSNYSGTMTAVDCWALPDENGNPPVINHGDSTASIQARNWSGLLDFHNVTNPVDIRVFLASGGVVLDPTVTSGDFLIAGVGILNDNSTSAIAVKTDGLMSKQTIAEAVDAQIGEEIQLSSFNGEIKLDVDNGAAGTAYPLGTHSYPVNNLTDAQTIASSLGLSTISLNGDLTLVSGDDVSDYHITGEGATINLAKSSVIMEDGCITMGTIFENLNLSGYQGGEVYGKHCVVGAIIDSHCEWSNCIMLGPMTMNNGGFLAGGHTTDSVNCRTGADWYVLDYNDSPVNQVYSNLTGKIKIINCTNSEANVLLSIDAGEVWIDSSCTAGNMVVSGSALLLNESSGMSVDSDGLSNRELITRSTWADVYLDVNRGEAGTSFPIGTLTNPSNNLADALTIASENNIRHISLSGAITLDRDCSGIHFTGSEGGAVNLNNQAIVGSEFYSVKVSGIQSGPASFRNAGINGVTGMDGNYHSCFFLNTTANAPAANSTIFMDNCRSMVPGSDSPVLDFSNGGISFNCRAYSGGIRVINSTDAANIATFEFIAGKFNFGTVNTAGYFAVRGVLDTSGIDFLSTATIAYDGAVSSSTVTDSIKSEMDASMLQILEMYRLMGLDPAKPLVVQLDQRDAGPEISQSIVVDEVLNKTTVTRQ